MHNDRVNRRPVACAAILAAATLALAGCGGDSSSTPVAGSSGASGSSTASRTTTTPAAGSSSPDPGVTVQGVTLTDQGTALKVGQPAKVSWHPNQKTTGVMKVSVTKLEKVPISAFKDWQLDAATQRSTPFYVHATVRNLGKGPLSGVPVPLYLLDGRNTLLQASTFRAQFPRLPEHASAGEVHARQEDLGLPGLLRAGPRQAGRASASAPPRTSTRSPGPARSAKPSGEPGSRRRVVGALRVGRQGARADNRGMPPLTLGPLTVPVPVVLAPMAGITNAAYRRLCAEQGAGLYVCEMITSRGLVERDSTTLKMLVFDELETTRSVQLYGTDPVVRRQGDRDPLRRVRRPPRRPQLRLPGAQGDPQGWRGSAAVEARAARRDPAVRGRRRHAVRRAGHHEDPQGARRRPPDLPRRRPDRGGLRLRRDRAARPHRRPVLQRPGRLGGHRPPGRARRHPGPRQRRHLGGGRRAADGRADRCRRCGRGPRLPRPPLAVPRPRRRVRSGSAGRAIRRRSSDRSVERRASIEPSRPWARSA